MTAIAADQGYKLKSKPERKNSDAKMMKSTVPVKARAQKSAAAQDLKRVEQQSAKVAGSKAKRQGPKTARVKVDREKGNPPIRFSSLHKGSGSGMNSQGSNPYRGRLKQKGGRH